MTAAVVFVFAFPGEAHAVCGNAAWAKPYGWGPASKTKTGVAGHPDYEQPYRWIVRGNVETFVCVQGWGFDGEREKDGRYKGRWYLVGCGKGDGGGTVPWGNVLDTPKLRAKSAGPNGAIVDWRC